MLDDSENIDISVVVTEAYLVSELRHRKDDSARPYIS